MLRIGRGVIGAAFALSLLFAVTELHAQPAAASADMCKSAYEDGDLLTNHSSGDKLLEARDKLRVCAGPSCKDWMIKDCAQWLIAVESRIPSVIVEAKDDAGNPILDVNVAADQRVLTTRIDGHSIEMNPGVHEFVFTLADGRHVDHSLVLRESDKNHVITVTFPRPAPPPPTPPPPVPVAPPAPVNTEPPPPSEPPPESHSWAASIVGFSITGVGLGVGIGTGLASLSEASDVKKQCKGNSCPSNLSGKADDAKLLGTISTVAFAVAGAGLLLAILTIPHSSSPKAGSALKIGAGFGSLNAMGSF